MEIWAVRGSRIVTQHPGFPRNYIICEIETYRGCPRYITGGCSFCTEPLYGEPRQRQIDGIVGEIESLYKHGVRAFRIGRQADLYTYGALSRGKTLHRVLNRQPGDARMYEFPKKPQHRLFLKLASTTVFLALSFGYSLNAMATSVGCHDDYVQLNNNLPLFLSKKHISILYPDLLFTISISKYKCSS